MRLFILMIFAWNSVLVTAEPLKPNQKQQKDDFDIYMNKHLETMNTFCGAKAKLKSDFSKWTPEVEKQYGPILGGCESVVGAFRGMCNNDAYKAVVASKLKEVECFYFGKGLSNGKQPNGQTAEREQDELTRGNMTFKNGVFTYRMGKHDQNIADNARKVLEKVLNE